MTTKVTSKGSSCPKQYLKLKRKIEEAQTAKISGFKMSLRGHLKSSYPKLYEEFKLGSNSVNLEDLYEYLDLPTTRGCLHCGSSTQMGSRIKPREFCNKYCASSSTVMAARRNAIYETRTGFSSPFANPESMKKRAKTWLRKFGVDNPSKEPDIRKRQSENSRKTWMRTTGYSNPAHNPAVKEKKKQVSLRNYGYKCALEDPEIWEKTRASYEKRTGYSHVSKDPRVKKLKEDNYFLKTGDTHPMHNPESFQKMQKSSVLRKTFRDSQGNDHICQGYEPIVLEFLDRHPKVEKFTTRNLPAIGYRFGTQEKQRKYYPDIGALRKDGTRCLIEVKSHWTLNFQADLNTAKFKAAKILAEQKGFEFWLVVADEKKKLLWKRISSN
jgi:hypothetical protein